MTGREDDAHGPLAEGALDAVFPGEDVAGKEKGSGGHKFMNARHLHVFGDP